MKNLVAIVILVAAGCCRQAEAAVDRPAPASDTQKLLLGALRGVWADTSASRDALQKKAALARKLSLVRERARALGPNISVCKNDKDGRWPSLLGADGKGKFDLVVTWWIGERQPQLSLLQSASKVHLNMLLEGQSEIKYLLRSYEKNGLLDHVRDLVLLIDADVVKQYGKPRFFDYSNKHIRVVTDEDMGLDNSGTGWYGKWSKWLNMHKIPGISDYFLYTSDDTFLVSKFDPKQHFYDEKLGYPVIYSYGDYKIGWCDRFAGSHH